MTAAIIAILAALVPFIVWLARRKITNLDDPKKQHEDRLEKIDAAIAQGPAGVDDINRQLSGFDRRLPDPGDGPAK